MIGELFVAIIVAGITAYIGITTMPDLPVVAFAGLIYVLPLVVNTGLIYHAYSRRKAKGGYASLFPIISTITYVALGVYLEKSGAWQEFVAKNSASQGDVVFEINAHMIDASQVVFVLLVYFSVAYIGYWLVRRAK